MVENPFQRCDGLDDVGIPESDQCVDEIGLRDGDIRMREDGRAYARIPCAIEVEGAGEEESKIPQNQIEGGEIMEFFKGCLIAFPISIALWILIIALIIKIF